MGFGIKRTPGDIAFSKCVREANDYQCQSCGINLRHNPGSMDLSHYISRGNNSTRLHKDNGFCLCKGCHMKMGNDPHQHQVFVRSILGDARYEMLMYQKQQLFRLGKAQDKEAKAHYQAELERIEKLRANGQQGYIDFMSWQ